MMEYFDAGHVLYMDNFYRPLSLYPTLQGKRTGAVGPWWRTGKDFRMHSKVQINRYKRITTLSFTGIKTWSRCLA